MDLLISFFPFRISPEHYFTELCLNSDSGAAEALGITLDLNLQYLCEVRHLIFQHFLSFVDSLIS